MKCRYCKVNKLANEFPPETVNENCQHPPFICLACVIFPQSTKCLEVDCGNDVDPDRVIWFQAIWNDMFKEYKPTETTSYGSGQDSKDVLYVTVLNGDVTEIPFDPDMSIQKIMTEVRARYGVDVDQQKLLYKGKELQIHSTESKLCKLKDYNVEPNSTIQLVKLLCAVPQDFNQVVFDLHWEYPEPTGIRKEEEKRDYLDASCLIFQGHDCKRKIDYVQKNPMMLAMMRKHGIKEKNWGAVHSGDKMDDKNRIGHHLIDVSINEIPEEVTHLFFALSAWNAENISKYPNPSLSFYEKSAPGKSLCSTSFSHAGDAEAVIMCSLSKSSSGRWVVYENGQKSSGNAKNYEPLIKTIQGLINAGY